MICFLKKLYKKILQKTIEPMCGDCSFKDMKQVIQKGSKYDKLTLKNHEISSRFSLLAFVNPMVYGYGQKLI